LENHSKRNQQLRSVNNWENMFVEFNWLQIIYSLFIGIFVLHYRDQMYANGNFV
jgi:hypothetical protein